MHQSSAQSLKLAPCAQVLISKEPTVAGRVAVHVAGLEDELGLLKQLDHPNIVRYLVRASSASAFACAVCDSPAGFMVSCARAQLKARPW